MSAPARFETWRLLAAAAALLLPAVAAWLLSGSLVTAAVTFAVCALLGVYEPFLLRAPSGSQDHMLQNPDRRGRPGDRP